MLQGEVPVNGLTAVMQPTKTAESAHPKSDQSDANGGDKDIQRKRTGNPYPQPTLSAVCYMNCYVHTKRTLGKASVFGSGDKEHADGLL